MAAVITSIDFDHQDLLGETLESIAREKAGVIKPGIPVVVGPVAPGAHAVIARRLPRARRAAGRRSRSRPRQHSTSRRHCGATTVTLEAGAHRLEDVDAGAAGTPSDRQRGGGVLPDDRARRPWRAARLHSRCARDLTEARWPGRLERGAWRGAEVLLDAAHNPAGARALADYLREHRMDRRDARPWRDARQGCRRHAVGSCFPAAARSICTTPPSPRALRRRRARGARVVGRAAVAAGAAHIVAIADPARAMAHACQARRASRRRRIDLSHRSAAWYSSLIFRVLDPTARRRLLTCCRPQPFACIAAILLTIVFSSSLGDCLERVAARAAVSRVSAAPQTPQSEICGCRVSEMSGATQDVLSKEVAGRDRTRAGADRRGRGSGPGGLRRHAVLCRLRRDLSRQPPHRRHRQRQGRVRRRASSAPSGSSSTRKSRTGTFYTAQRHGVARRPRRPQHVRHAGSRTRCSGATRSTSSDPRSTRSWTARSAPACSRRRAGRSSSGSATLNLDDYALLKNSVFRVKGVPVMYLPIFYYPIQEDDRATGFLIPDLRHLDASAASRSATRSSGRSRAARMRRSCTTGSPRPASRWVASIATC